MKPKNDYDLIAESYTSIYSEPVVAEATGSSKQQDQSGSRIKDMQGFNANLTAIDQLEDKMIEFVNTAQKTGWMTGQEIGGAQKVLQNFLTQTIMSLLVSTELKDQKQLQQALQSIQSKIKFVDTRHVASVYQQFAARQQGQQSQAAAHQQQQPAGQQQAATSPATSNQPMNYGARPGQNYRAQAAVDTMKNFGLVPQNFSINQ